MMNDLMLMLMLMLLLLTFRSIQLNGGVSLMDRYDDAYSSITRKSTLRITYLAVLTSSVAFATRSRGPSTCWSCLL